MNNKILLYVSAVIASLSASGLFLLVATLSVIRDDGGGSLWGENSNLILKGVEVAYVLFVTLAIYLFYNKLGSNLLAAILIFGIPASLLLLLFL